MGEWHEMARRGAAREFGRRHWRWFAAAEISRRVVPNLMILAAVVMAVGLAVRYSAWILPRLLLLAVASAALGVALWVWRRWRRLIRAGFYWPAGVTACLLLAGGGLVWWAI